jgi:outer membrane protein
VDCQRKDVLKPSALCWPNVSREYRQNIDASPNRPGPELFTGLNIAACYNFPVGIRPHLTPKVPEFKGDNMKHANLKYTLAGYLQTAAFLAAIAFTFSGFGHTAAAQTPAPVRIGVIDTEKILLSSNAGKTAMANLKKIQTDLEAQGKAKQQEIKDLQTAIHDFNGTLDKLAEMNSQLEKKTLDLQHFQDDAQRQLTKKRDEILAGIDEMVMPAINAIGKEGGWTVIFRKFESGLIFAADAVDITDTVIARLNNSAAQHGTN